MEDEKLVSNFKACWKGRWRGKVSLAMRFSRQEKAGRSGETAAAICNLQKSGRFCRSVNGRANWKTSVRRLPVTGARSARLRSLPFCRPTADFPLPDFRLTSPRSLPFFFINFETNHIARDLPSCCWIRNSNSRDFSFVESISINTTRRRSERGGGRGRTARFQPYHRNSTGKFC